MNSCATVWRFVSLDEDRQQRTKEIQDSKAFAARHNADDWMTHGPLPVSRPDEGGLKE